MSDLQEIGKQHANGWKAAGRGAVVLTAIAALGGLVGQVLSPVHAWDRVLERQDRQEAAIIQLQQWRAEDHDALMEVKTDVKWMRRAEEARQRGR